MQCEHGCSGVGDPPPPPARSVTTGLLGSVCWLGPELAGGGCHHRTASQSAAARGGLYPSRGSPSRGTECGLVQPVPWPGLLLGGAGPGRPPRPAGWDRRETVGGSALVWWVAAWRLAPPQVCPRVGGACAGGVVWGVPSCWWVCLGAEPAVPPWPSAHSLALTAFLLCRCCQV